MVHYRLSDLSVPILRFKIHQIDGLDNFDYVLQLKYRSEKGSNLYVHNK